MRSQMSRLIETALLNSLNVCTNCEIRQKGSISIYFFLFYLGFYLSKNEAIYKNVLLSQILNRMFFTINDANTFSGDHPDDVPHDVVRRLGAHCLPRCMGLFFDA